MDHNKALGSREEEAPARGFCLPEFDSWTSRPVFTSRTGTVQNFSRLRRIVDGAVT